MLYLLNKPHQYLLVWSYMYANSSLEGVYCDNYQNLLARFKLSRSTLQRVIDCGCDFTFDGQKVGSFWAAKELKIIFVTNVSGQKVGRKWAGKSSKPKQDLNDFQEIKTKNSKKVTGVYADMVKEYDLFCSSQMGMGAKMNALQGKSMNEIITYLKAQVIAKKGVSTDEMINLEVLKAWQFVLQNWSVLDAYYGKQIKLNQINSNLPNILTQLRNNKKKLRNEKFASTVNQVEGINFEETQS